MRTALLAALALLFTPTAALADHHEEAPVEVMVLGVYHFANPGLDVINVDTDDVLTPQRQRDLQAIADSLAEWQPDRILLEAQPDTEDLHLRSYRENPEERIAEDRNEHFQLGFRLALQLDHDDVYGFDEQPGDDEPDYFPIDRVQAFAESNGMTDQLGAMFGWAETMIGGLSADDAECSIAANLLAHNDPAWLQEGHSRLYYGMLAFGDADDQPGAELNAYWFMRNAKMFAKIGLIAEPGERVLVIVGSGHKYWLDQLARNTPGFASADPLPYLEAADDGRCMP